MSTELRNTPGTIASKRVEGGLPVNGDILQFNATTNLWEMNPIPTPAAPVQAVFAKNGGGNRNFLQGTTNFISISEEVPDGLETQVHQPVKAMTVTKVLVRIPVNTANVITTVTLRKNGADTALTFTIGAGATGVFSGTDSISFADGDTISIKVVLPAGAGQAEMAGHYIEYEDA